MTLFKEKPHDKNLKAVWQLQSVANMQINQVQQKHRLVAFLMGIHLILYDFIALLDVRGQNKS